MTEVPVIRPITAVAIAAIEQAGREMDERAAENERRKAAELVEQLLA